MTGMAVPRRPSLDKLIDQRVAELSAGWEQSDEHPRDLIAQPITAEDLRYAMFNRKGERVNPNSVSEWYQVAPR